jgi:hypothetical protein
MRFAFDCLERRVVWLVSCERGLRCFVLWREKDPIILPHPKALLILQTVDL